MWASGGLCRHVLCFVLTLHADQSPSDGHMPACTLPRCGPSLGPCSWRLNRLALPSCPASNPTCSAEQQSPRSPGRGGGGAAAAAGDEEALTAPSAPPKRASRWTAEEEAGGGGAPQAGAAGAAEGQAAQRGVEAGPDAEQRGEDMGAAEDEEDEGSPRPV